MQSKYYIRITDDTEPAPKYLQRICSDGRPLFTASSGFAKRFITLELAEEIAAKMRSQTSARDGESSLIEIIDTLTDRPVGEPEEEPRVVKPPDIPPFPGSENNGEWNTRFKFVWCKTGQESTFEMCRIADGIKCRYKPLLGGKSEEYPKAKMISAFRAWLDCIIAWAVNQIEEKSEAVKK